MELLSPAGSYEAVIAAVQSGADAVYLGGSRFGARQSAKNFEIPDMKKWIDYCHLYGVKVYVTVNTLIKDSELDDLAEYVKDLASVHPDALIVQDMGAVTVIRTVAPTMPIHASTQMTATSLEDVQFLENLGIERVVLSRELSAVEIKYISQNTSCELEVFVHGALCMSYSGQCLMSSILGGRSGNRGRCAQPCRLSYTLEGSGEKSKGFLLSPKDLCLAEEIKTLEEIGVSSLKIEGRLKRAGYVSTVVGVYRKLMDSCKKPDKADIKALSDAFGRGFTKGLFGCETGKKMMSHENSSNASEHIFSKEALDRTREDANFRKIPVTINVVAKIGKPFTARMQDFDGNSVSYVSDFICEKAEKTPTGKDRIISSMEKLGAEPFISTETVVDADCEAVIPVSALNLARRSLCELLKNERIKRERIETYPFIRLEKHEKKDSLDIWCMVETKEQFDAAKNLGIENIITAFDNKESIKRLGFVTKSTGAFGERVIVSNTGQLLKCENSQITGGSRLNITNSLSAEFYGAFMDKAIISPELSLKEIKNLTSHTSLSCGVIGYGRLDLMLCANCPAKAAGKCQNKENKLYLRDRMGEKFPLLCTEDCVMRILNSKPIYMADKWNDFKSCGIDFVCLVFTTETKEECSHIIKEYINAKNGIKANQMRENTFTRGHFYRGIL